MKKMDFYFDFTSPYSYISFMRLINGELLKSYDVSFRPVMVGRIFSLNEMSAPAQSKNKAIYLFKEALREARKNNIELTSPLRLPFNSLPQLRIALGLSEERELQIDFIRKTFDYGWKHGFDYEDHDSYKSFIVENCLSLKKFNELDGDRLLRKSLKNEINNAFERGVFGVPTFVVDNDLYWGNAYLDTLANNEILDYNNDELIKFEKFFKE